MPEFYKSREWQKVRVNALRRDGFRCTICGADVRAKGSNRVDHIEPVKARPDLALRLDNVRTLCASCDNMRHSEKGRGGVEKVKINLSGFPDDWE